MLPEYEPFCYADPWFYEWPAHEAPTDDHFAAVPEEWTVPGWTRIESANWTYFLPDGHVMPPQGWKVHVSAHAGNADRVVHLVWDYCVDKGLHFKVVPNPVEFSFRNSKYAARDVSGKLVTIYPRDEQVLFSVLTDLDEELRGEAGPYILTDVRWGNGPVYTRYGSFVKRFMDDGSGRIAIEDPTGKLVPDPRDVVFTVPDWVQIPEFLAPHIEAHRRPVMDDFPWRIIEALHFSNGGGVYRAQGPTAGEHVIVKEGRPYAGVDRLGRDAVARLRHERDMLERVLHLPQVPTLIDYRVIAEHEFLVETFIEGDSLQATLAQRCPIIRGRAPTDREMADYVSWALDIWCQADEAIRRIHEAGVVFGDLHPNNILIRPDGRIVLVDWEASFDVCEPQELSMGDPGYVLPGTPSGFERDTSALALLKIALFAPLTKLIHLSSVKLRQVVSLVCREYKINTSVFSDALERIECGDSVRRGQEAPLAEDELPAEPSSWPALCQQIASGILEVASPGRADRLFPGDILQFRAPYNGMGFGVGAAGVLWALHTACEMRFPEGEQWLLAHAMTPRDDAEPGFYHGDGGIAYVLWHLGYQEEAVHLIQRPYKIAEENMTSDLVTGLAGVVLSWLHFYKVTGEDVYVNKAQCAADTMRDRLHTNASFIGRKASMQPAGLMQGFSGIALSFVHLFEVLGDVRYLDYAEDALRRDLRRCVEVEADDGAIYLEDQGRFLPYLAFGSAGIGLVLQRYLQHVVRPDLERSLQSIKRAARSSFYLFPGLFDGTAGMLLCNTQFLTSQADEVLVRRNVRMLNWHVLHRRGEVAFPGNQLMRLSADLSTGAAGVLLAVAAASQALGAQVLREEAALPFLSNAVPNDFCLQMDPLTLEGG